MFGHFTILYMKGIKFASATGSILESKGMRAIFQKKGKKKIVKKGQNIWKFGQKCTKFENILKKGRRLLIHLSFWIWKRWKEREKITKICISWEGKEPFRWNKKHFHSFWRAIILGKNKNLIKNSGHKL